MKKEALIILLFLSISLVTAQPQLTLQHEDFQPGETLLAEITTPGNFASIISTDNIKFYQGRKQISLNHNLIFYNNKYFFYIQDLREGNFTIKISDILYKTPELKEASIEKEIIVKNNYIDENQTQTAILAITPGFAFTSQPVEFTLKNKGNTNLNITEAGKTITLQPEDFQKIIITPNQTISYLELSTYKDFKVPIIYIPLTTPTQQEEQPIDTELKPSPIYLHVNINHKQTKNKTVELFNFGETNITGITISHNQSVIEVFSQKSIQAKSSTNITLTIYTEEQGYIQEDLIITYNEPDQKTIIIPIYIYIFPEDTPEEQQVISTETCEQLGGNPCQSLQKCDGSWTFSSDKSSCCIGTCIDKEGTGEFDWSWVIGIGITIFLVIISLLIFKKIKKTKPKKPEEQLKEKSKAYEKRVKGRLDKN